MTKLVYKYQEKSKERERALLLVEYDGSLSDACHIKIIGADGVITLGGISRRLSLGEAVFRTDELPDGELSLSLTCGAIFAKAHGLIKEGGAVYPRLLGIDGIGGLEARINELENEASAVKAKLIELEEKIGARSSFTLGNQL